MNHVQCAVLAGFVSLTACGGGEAPDRTEPVKTASPAPDGGAAEARSPICRYFTQAQMAKYIGTPVGAPEDIALGCQWSATDDSGDAIVAVVPAANHEPPKASAGFKPLAEPGRDGFVAPYMDGWLAGAIVGEEALRVSVAGPGASEATAVALLKDAAAAHASSGKR